MNYGSVVFTAIIVGSLSYYFFPKYGARNWFKYFSIQKIELTISGPVHALQQEITPEMVAAVQK